MKNQKREKKLRTKLRKKGKKNTKYRRNVVYEL